MTLAYILRPSPALLGRPTQTIYSENLVEVDVDEEVEVVEVSIISLKQGESSKKHAGESSKKRKRDDDDESSTKYGIQYSSLSKI